MLDLRHVRFVTADIQEQLDHRREGLAVFVAGANVADVRETPGKHLIQRLQAEKAQRDSDLATRKRDAQSFQSIHDFVRSLGKEITEFDEKLVRRLVDRITISDEAITVTFKSGKSVEIKG